AALVGAAVGLLGARLALPSIPLFLDSAPVPRPLFGIAGGPIQAVLLATAAALLVLVAAGFAATRLIGRRVGPDRLRENAR
ncbi:MAG TPA: hypothetical protein VFD94_04925, partial [Jatrophihabitans sp.]|nr:hypothetical protein [Jatrophihabitans sp.]